MFDAQALADRYVAAWNERDADRRRNAIAALWSPGALRHPGVREAREYEVLDKRILGLRETTVGRGGNRFRAARNANGLSDVVTFRWEMLAPDSETVLASGLEFLIVDDEGRILVDHQLSQYSAVATIPNGHSVKEIRNALHRRKRRDPTLLARMGTGRAGAVPQQPGLRQPDVGLSNDGVRR
jgi:hypothetical protein